VKRLVKQEIQTDKAPKPVGPYSQAIKVNGFLFISGQIPLDPETNRMIEGDFKTKARRILENIRQIVESAGGSMDSIVKITVYLTDISKFAELNDVYKEYFNPPYPSRSVVEVKGLPKGSEIEIEAIAYIG